MADLTRDVPLRFRYPTQLKNEKWVVDNSTAQTIFRGQPVFLDASIDTVNVRGWVAATTLVVATDIVIGIANERKNVKTTDIETDNEIEVITAGEVGFLTSAFTDADVGKNIAFSDSGTLVAAASATNRLSIGTLVRVVDGYAFVELAGKPTFV